jgi:excisionase family DNA binding protein
MALQHRNKQWLTVREAAQRLGVQTLQVYSLVWSAKLGAEKVDGAWRVLAGDVDARAARLSKRKLARTSEK